MKKELTLHGWIMIGGLGTDTKENIPAKSSVIPARAGMTDDLVSTLSMRPVYHMATA